MINLVFNGEPRSMPGEMTLKDAIEYWNLGDELFAIAVNERFVPNSDYSERKLVEGDRIELVTPIFGG